MITVLHTADWHLGKRLEQCDRSEEHSRFLAWLLDTIREEKVDVLIVAGDIFDTGAPPAGALKQYYDFLWQLRATTCRAAVIIGGNHDSVATLNAPKDLLRFFNVHVIGGVPDRFEEQLIPIGDAQGNVELLICAAPFLRDRDLRLSVAGEKQSEIEERLKEGICAHYRKFLEHIEPYKSNGVPVIATGHLFAQGANASDSEKDIHVGNLAQICADQFPEEFNYVALGHLHRPQRVGGRSNVRYSGSPIPLSFSECEDEKGVLLLRFSGKDLHVEERPVPPCRKLLRVQGTIDEVRQALASIRDSGHPLPAWVEVQLYTNSYLPGIEEELMAALEGQKGVERLFVRQRRERVSRESAPVESESLFDLTPQAVFRKRLEKEEEPEAESLTRLFNTALELMAQPEEAAERKSEVQA